MRTHLLKRFAGFLIGVILLYAPFALFTRLAISATASPLCADCHRICLRMPIQWLAQPWMYPTMLKQPMFLVAIVALPGLALLFGPLFCGWICPPGAFTEFLSRLVPDRFKLNLAGKINPAPIRYGVLAGLMAAPFLGGNACCAFCNFTHMQNLINALFGNFTGLAHWASFTFAAFVVWFFVLGVFVKGGRGWCNFLCPAGALMGLAHALGARLGWARTVAVDESRCASCQTCVAGCPAWAMASHSPARVNPHACNTCFDCIHLCPHHAVTYRRRTRTGR